jgi:uncharacterized protein (TIGR00645 family)
MKNIETKFEQSLYSTRWLLAPFYVALVVSVVALLVKMCVELYHMVTHMFTITESELVVHILTLIDVTLIANLMFIIIFSGYHSFVSKMETVDDGPSWLGKVGFAALKLKVIGSIMTISAVELLKVFINIGAYTESELMWKVVIHMAFVLSGTLFALSDKLSPAH